MPRAISGSQSVCPRATIRCGAAAMVVSPNRWVTVTGKADSASPRPCPRSWRRRRPGSSSRSWCSPPRPGPRGRHPWRRGSRVSSVQPSWSCPSFRGFRATSSRGGRRRAGSTTKAHMTSSAPTTVSASSASTSSRRRPTSAARATTTPAAIFQSSPMRKSYQNWPKALGTHGVPDLGLRRCVVVSAHPSGTGSARERRAPSRDETRGAPGPRPATPGSPGPRGRCRVPSTAQNVPNGASSTPTPYLTVFSGTMRQRLSQHAPTTRTTRVRRPRRATASGHVVRVRARR